MSQESKDKIFAEISKQQSAKIFCEWLIKHGANSVPIETQKCGNESINTACTPATLQVLTQQGLFAIEKKKDAVAAAPIQLDQNKIYGRAI